MVRFLVALVAVSACDSGLDCEKVLAKADPILKDMLDEAGIVKSLHDNCRAHRADPRIECLAKASSVDEVGACLGKR